MHSQISHIADVVEEVVLEANEVVIKEGDEVCSQVPMCLNPIVQSHNFGSRFARTFRRIPCISFRRARL